MSGCVLTMILAAAAWAVAAPIARCAEPPRAVHRPGPHTVQGAAGLSFESTGGDYTGTGLYAAVSYDEGQTWPDRRLVAADGRTTADINGYLALAQGRDGVIHLITSKDHYAFNLAWMKARPPAP